MNVKRNQSGQAIVLTVVFLTALLGMAALVLDVGSWYRAHRNLQATADASALAGAQALPDTPGDATSLAGQYASKNAPDLASTQITLSSQLVANDTIKVHVSRPAPGFFSKLFGVDSVQEGASATARTEGMTEAKYVAPIAVNIKHPLLAGVGCPCFDDETTIPLGKTGAPGAFDLLNLDGSRGGTSPGDLADWMLRGFQDYLPLGDYYSDPGAKFNSSQMQAALQARIGTVLMFPVYDVLSGNGANAQYHVIGWVGFYLESFDARGSSGEITGHFTEVIWDGLPATSGGASSPPNLGAHAVQLVD
jgi:Flp pilus assembly protein TadG